MSCWSTWPGIAPDGARELEQRAPLTIPDRAKGETVIFQIKNLGALEHVFMVGPMADAFANKKGTPEITGGTTKSITFIFSGPGPFGFACHATGHFEAGMKGTLTVIGGWEWSLTKGPISGRPGPPCVARSVRAGQPMAVVLVADDDRDMLARYGAILEELGRHQTRLQLIVAGELEAADAAGVDALIVDLHRERDHLAGLDAIERIRADPATRELPIILPRLRGRTCAGCRSDSGPSVQALLKPFRIENRAPLVGYPSRRVAFGGGSSSLMCGLRRRSRAVSKEANASGLVEAS